MHPHRPVPQRSHPPHDTQGESIFDGFSPVRENKSSSSTPESSHPQRLRKGLGGKDIRNNMTTKSDGPNPSPLKRGSVSLDTDDIRRLKRHRLTSVYEDDMDWIKREIKDIKRETKDVKREIKDIKEETKDIKAWMIELEEFFKEEVNFRIGEVLYQLEQMN